MGFNFPDSPTIGQLHPTPAVAGIPQYQWNGNEWVTPEYNPLNYVLKSGDTMLGALNVVTPPTAAAHAASKSYVDTYAAPLDALSYSGMQVNGGFEISQEKGTAGTTVSGAYVSDGWLAVGSGIIFNAAQDNAVLAPGFGGRLYINATTARPSLGANDYLMLSHRIEGYRVARLAWGTPDARPITICFWSQHIVAGTYSVCINNLGSTRSYATTYTQNVGNVLEYKTVTIPGDTTGTWLKDNTLGMAVNFASACGTTYIVPSANAWHTGNYTAAPGQVNGAASTSNYIILRGVVILPGIYAPTAAQSPLIMRSFDQELVTCKRYWQRIYAGWTGDAIATGVYTNYDMLSVQMRTTPACGAAAITGGSAVFGSPAVAGVNDHTFWVSAAATSTNTGAGYAISAQADARL